MTKRIFAVLLLSMMCFGQSITQEAESKIAKERHEKLVQRAKELLEEKEELQAKLEEVEKDLTSVNEGKMPKKHQDAVPSITTSVFQNSACCITWASPH